MRSAHGHEDLDATARRVIYGNHYMMLATLDPDGRPRLSPVYYTCVRRAAFYWVSSAGPTSRSLAERPAVEIVTFDSPARVGEGEAVYIAAKATVVADRELDEVAAEAVRTTAGARQLTPRDLRQSADPISAQSARRRHLCP